MIKKRYSYTEMLKIACVTFAMLFSNLALCQSHVIDSLEKVMKTHTIRDTSLVNTMNSLAFSYYSVDVSKTIELVEKAHKIASTLNYTRGKARAIYIRGIAFTVQSDYQKAIDNFDKASEMYASVGDSTGISSSYNALGIANYYQGNLETSIHWYKKSIEIDRKLGSDDVKSSYLNIGSTYGELGAYDDAIKYYRKALHLNVAKKDSSGISGCYNNIGTLYSEQGNFPLALQNYNKSLRINEKLRDSLSLILDYNNIGIIFKKRSNYKKALEFYQKSLAISQSIGDKKAMNHTTMNIGIIYNNQLQYEQAIPLFKKALKSSKEIGDNRLVSSCLNNLGDAYYALNNYDQAFYFYNQAKEVNQELGFQLSQCNSLLGLANVYYKKGELEKSLKHALESREIAINSDLLTYQRDVSKLLAEIYEKKKQFKRAFEFQQTYKLLSDSVYNKEKIEKIAQIEYDYKFQKELEEFNAKEKKLTKKVERTNQDLEKSESRFLVGMVVFLGVLLIAVVIIFQLRLRHVKSRNENVLLEQKLLRSQMTPHFIFNSMSVLQGMILNQEDVKANQYLSKFSRLLRITLESSREKMTSLSQELQALEHYVALQHLESENPIAYTVEIDESIQLDEVLIPPMLIQPFIENAIEHGFRSESIDKKIEVKIYFRKQNLFCIIQDNGVGLDATKRTSPNRKKSLATSITKERIELLSKELKNGGMVEVEDRKKWNEHGTIVTLIIPHRFVQTPKTD